MEKKMKEILDLEMVTPCESSRQQKMQNEN